MRVVVLIPSGAEEREDQQDSEGKRKARSGQNINLCLLNNYTGTKVTTNKSTIFI